MAEQNYVLSLVAKLTSQDPGDVLPSTVLVDIDWDSLCVLEFIAKLDSDYGIRVSADDLANAKVVDDLIVLAQG